MFRPRNPPRFTRTLYDSHILWDSHLLWDGITVIDPTWSERSQVTSNFTPRTGPQTLYTWGNANITWGNAHFTWGGKSIPSWTPRN